MSMTSIEFDSLREDVLLSLRWDASRCAQRLACLRR